MRILEKNIEWDCAIMSTVDGEEVAVLNAGMTEERRVASLRRLSAILAARRRDAR